MNKEFRLDASSGVVSGGNMTRVARQHGLRSWHPTHPDLPKSLTRSFQRRKNTIVAQIAARQQEGQFPMTTIPCPQCGELLPPHARFCRRCGQALSSPAAPPGSSSLPAGWKTASQEPGGSASPMPGPSIEAQPFPGMIHQIAFQAALPPPVAPAPSPRPQRRVPTIAVLALCAVVVLGAVGTGLYFLSRSLISGTSGGQAPGTSPSRPSTSPVSGPFAFNAPASTDMAGLYIQTFGLGCQSQLVIKQPHATYDTTAIQHMQSYLAALGRATGYLQAYGGPYGPFFDRHDLPPLPETLQWIPGGDQCLDELDFTATGSESIQITSIGVTFDADAMPNAFAYQLVDICSVVGLHPPPAGSCGCTGCGSGGGSYRATLMLPDGPAGTQVNAPITAGFNSPLPLTVDPTQPEVQSVDLSVASALPQALYQVKLTVTIITAEGTKVLVLPSSFISRLVFASASQFSCYQLQGNSFLQEPLPGDPTQDPRYSPTQAAFPCV